jgi:LacI family transcriptional regulator
VGVLVQPQDSYWREVCYGIHDRLIESEHLPFFLWNNDRLNSGSEEYSLEQIHRLLDRWVDGVIFWPFFADLYKQHLPEFQNRNIPIVAIHHKIDNVHADVVESDETQIGKLAAGHIAGLGHREILVVAGPPGIHWADSRAGEITAHLKKISGTVVHEVHIQPGARHYADATIAVTSTMKAHPRITAVIACTDKFAQNVYDAAATLGWDIPRRVSVIGVADLDFAAVMSPPLTTIRQDGYAIGRRAALVELERSTGLLTGPPRSFREPVALIVRHSTARNSL